MYRQKAIEHRYRSAWGRIGRKAPGSTWLTILLTAVSLSSVGAILWYWH